MDPPVGSAIATKRPDVVTNNQRQGLRHVPSAAAVIPGPMATSPASQEQPWCPSGERNWIAGRGSPSWPTMSVLQSVSAAILRASVPPFRGQVFNPLGSCSAPPLADAASLSCFQGSARNKQDYRGFSTALQSTGEAKLMPSFPVLNHTYRRVGGDGTQKRSTR